MARVKTTSKVKSLQSPKFRDFAKAFQHSAELLGCGGFGQAALFGYVTVFDGMFVNGFRVRGYVDG